MDALDLQAFSDLFREVYAKCFGHALQKPLSESESRHLSNEIEAKTGLVIGWKSVKNYAAFVLNDPPGKRENPSVATLDTLARYAAGAAPSSEVQRKKQGADYAWWFRYREQYRGSQAMAAQHEKKPVKWIGALSGLVVLLGIVFGAYYLNMPKPDHILQDFQDVNEWPLRKSGWFLQARDSAAWANRGEKPGQLTLFTLYGDNWPKTGEAPVIRNLMLQKIHSACFSTDVQFADFIPTENWQQAGLLLLEDTAFAGKSLRLSLAYNDFFGGYSRPGEILIQAIASYGKVSPNLEEVAHHTLFTLGGPGENRIVAENLKHSAVRIEKQGHKYRFLYSASPNGNFSFKELAVYEFDMEPRFAGIFALKGFVDTTAVIPVAVKSFRLEGYSCQ